MTDMQSGGATRPYVTSTQASADSDTQVGWVVFAGVMLFLVGTFQIVAGLVALLNKDYYLVTSDKLVVHLNFTGWGVIHLVIGIVALFAGFGVMSGAQWARIFGIALACVGALTNLAFIAAYPVWGVILITLDVLVIYALAVHGRGAMVE